MSINNDDEYSSHLQKMYSDLKSLKEVDCRRKRFCCLCDNDWMGSIENHSIRDRVLIQLMNCESLFPSDEDKKYFFKFALDKRSWKMIKLFEAGNFKVHEVRVEDGRSALHYLAEVMYGKNDDVHFTVPPKVNILKLMDHFLETAGENHQDDLGYTYLHGACMSGNVAAVNRFLSQGVDVNLDTYTCSPLHLAVQYRHEEIVEMLLRNGADPNKRDHELATPLHALARLCLCQCTTPDKFCDKRKPVDEIVEMLVDRGASVEARDRRGYTPLESSLSRLDLRLARSLLERGGASLDNFNEDRLFEATFTPLELKNYPLTLDAIETIHFLRSRGRDVSLNTRLRMIKYWMCIRGNDTDHLISAYTGILREFFTIVHIVHKIFIHRNFGLYIAPKTQDFLNRHIEKLESIVTDYYGVHKPTPPSKVIDDLTLEVARLESIMLNDDVSLYRICQMSHSEAYSMIKKFNNRQLPPMDQISCTYVNIIAKRHLANILIRPHLEWLAADLFMTDWCQLNLPYTACYRVAEYTSVEDLFRLCERAADENESRSSRRKRRLWRNMSDSVDRAPVRRSRRLRGLPANRDDDY